MYLPPAQLHVTLAGWAIALALVALGVSIRALTEGEAASEEAWFQTRLEAEETAAREALKRCEIDISRIKCVVPHQANRRIIEAVGERIGARPDQLFINVDKYVNTSAASVAITLDEAVSSGRVQRGELILLVVF